MPKNKFNGFYYGVGLKFDEASIDKAGQQLEGRLNQVVDNLTQKASAISDAVARGVKDVDAKELIKSLADAQRELNQFQNFDPNKLQKQIGQLSNTVQSLGDQFKDVSSQLKSFTDDVTTRLSNIEIRTSKQGVKALKTDLELMKTYAQKMMNSKDIDFLGLDKYVQKIKDGFASIKASGNPMEIFADKEIAHYFVDLTNILRQMGDPVKELRSEFFDLSSTFKTSFEKTDVSGSKSIFKNVGYQIEAVGTQLKRSEAQLDSYKEKIKELNRRRHSSGFAITDSEDKNLDFDQKIAKIKQYDDIIQQSELGSQQWYEATRKQIALAQAAEKELTKLGAGINGTQYMKKWKTAFGADLDDKYSQFLLSTYVEQAQEDIVALGKIYAEAFKEVKKGQVRLDALMAKEPITESSAKKKKSTKAVITAVELKAKINKGEWAKTINTALKNIEKGGKVKPFKIKVEATQGKILEEIKKIREASLVGDTRKNAKSDSEKFNKKFNDFYKNLQQRRQEIIDELKKNWHPALKDAFTFKMELLGIDNKSITKDINMYMLSTVDVINQVLETKPLEFHSNIDKLLDEIQTKVKDRKIEGNVELTAGNLAVAPQSLSNVAIIAQNVMENGANVSAPQTQSQSATPASSGTSPSSLSNGSSKQEVYEDALTRVTNMLSATSDPSVALQKVKDGAQKLYAQLIKAEEGTEEYYKAQILLTVLLSKWRGKIGGRNANPAFKVSGVLGARGANKTWEKYLVDNGILPSEISDRVITSASKLEEIYALKTPKTKSTRKAKPNDIETAEQQMANDLKHGRDIIQHYIKLAKWAKALKPIAETSDLEIKESMFKKDHDTTKIRGQWYTRKDIGKIIPGEKINIDDLETFIAEYEQSENEEDKQLFGFLKKLIDAFKGNKQQLDTLLKDLSGSEVVGKYNAADDKSQYLATNITSSFKRMMSPKGNQQAQKHISDIFGKYNIDLSGLLTAKTAGEKWHLIQSQLIDKESLDFDGLMSELGSLEGNVGKTYENFMTLLKVSKAYMVASNSLGEIGKEAALLQGGRRETQNKYRKEYDARTGRTYLTDEIIGTKSPIVEKGFRQFLNDLAVTFRDKTGNIIGGFNAGKGIVSPDDYFNGSSSYTSIIKFLTRMLNEATTIAFDTDRKGAQGYMGVAKSVLPSESVDAYDLSDSVRYLTENKTSAITQKSEIEQYIKNINILISGYETKLKTLNDELASIIASDNNPLSQDDINQIVQTQTEIRDKDAKLQQTREQITQQSIKIEDLQKNIANPEPLYEDILKSLLNEESQLAKLESEIAHKRANKKNYNDELEINKLVEQKKQIENKINNFNASLGVAALGADNQKINAEIEKETAEITKLEAELQQKQSADNQNEKVQLEQEIARKKRYIENLSTALQKRARAKTKEALEVELSNRQAELLQMQNEETELKNQLASLNGTLSKFGSADVIKRVIGLVKEQEAISAQIKEQHDLLAQRQKELKNADSKTVKYSKTYNQAITALPQFEENSKIVGLVQKVLSTQYQADVMQFAAELRAQVQQRAMSQKDMDNLVGGIPDITKLNEQLTSGALTQEEYIKKITDAYTLMGNTSDTVDAQRLAQATLLIKKYQEQIGILKEIIKTQKPKEEVKPQPTATKNTSSTGSQQSRPTQTTTDSGTDNTELSQAQLYNTNGIVLNLNSAGLATESTVGKIYNLLSQRQGKTKTAYGAQIEAQTAENNKQLKSERAKTAETQKQLEVQKELVAMHGLPTKNLINALTEGAFPSPSIAVTKPDIYGGGYGDATVVFKKSAIDPKSNPANKIYGVDAYTPTYPSFGYELNPEGLIKASEQTGIAIDDLRWACDGAYENIQQAVETLGLRAGISDDFKEAYIKTHGFEIQTKEEIAPLKNSFHTDYEGTPSYARDFIAREDITFDAIVNNDAIQKAYFEAIEKQVEAYNAQYEDFPQAQIKKYKITDFTNRILAARTDSDIYATEKVDFEHDQGVVRGQLKVQDMGAYYRDVQRIISENRQDYINFVEKILQEIMVKPNVKGFKGQRFDRTPEGIAAAMSSYGGKGALYDEDPFMRRSMDSQAFIIAASKNYSSIADVIADTSRLQKDATGTHTPLESGYIQGIARTIAEANNIEDEIAFEKILQAVDGNSTAESIGKALRDSGLNVDSTVVDKIAAMVEEALQVPTKYFEAKPQRALGLEDIEFVSVPKDSPRSNELKTLLQEKGINYVEHMSDDKTSRIDALKSGVQQFGDIAQEVIEDVKETLVETSTDTKKTRVPQMPNIAKASLQAEEIGKLTNINKDSSLYKQYITAKQQLDNTVATVVAKGKDRTKEDTDEIKALSSAVTSLGKQIINSANNFEQFKERGGEAFSFTAQGAQTLEDEMRELAHNDALNSKSLLRDISYDEATQKLNYSLTDIEGDVTKVTMAYNDLLGVVLKTSDKTTASASKLYNAIEGEMTQRIRTNDTVERTPALSNSKQYQDYIVAYNNMMSAQDALRAKGTMATKAEKDELTSLIGKVEETRGEFEQLAKASAEFAAKIDGGTWSDVDPTNLEAEMKAFVLSQEGLTRSQKAMIEQTWVFKNAQDGATYSVRRGKDEVASMSVIFDRGTRQIGQYTVETKKYKTGMEKFMDSLKGKWQEVARYLMTFGSVYRVFAVLKQGVTYVREIDSALTELKKVTDETEETYDRFLNTAAKTADKVGSTIKEIVSSTADFARLGYNLQDATKMAESAQILMNVSEFTDISSATDSLISAIQAFSYTADESLHVVDIMNTIGKHKCRNYIVIYN